MKIVVNRDLCESNAVCVRRAPEVFALGDDEQLRVLVESPGPELLEEAQQAVRRCPKRALALTDE
jgi:ferredoxin